MKKLLSVTFAMLMLTSIPLLGQNPVPDPDTLPGPVKEGDPALRTLPPRLDYVEDRKRITPEEVPLRVRESLESSAQYTDWQKATLYHDSNKDEYIVEFRGAGRVTTYRFNHDGKPIVERK